MNRCFDLLGLTYPNWPAVDLKDTEGSRKRKRAEAGEMGQARPSEGAWSWTRGWF